jgi:S1-C subfamily serine protease
MKRLAVVAGATLTLACGVGLAASPNINASAPLETNSSAAKSLEGVNSVFRVVCTETKLGGTAFLHKSGDVITAAHVTEGCTHPVILMHDNSENPATIVATDIDKDLVLLKPSKKINAQALRISAADKFDIGTEISFWGYPAGYIGIPPMISVGYLAGLDAVRSKSENMHPQWVVNAAINHGNSGGPVVLVETGEVIGVADSKVAPLSDTAISALNALQAQSSGFMYTARKPDGTTQSFSEGQVIAMVLEELRQQIQLVIGHAVLVGDLRAFLKDNGIDP